VLAIASLPAAMSIGHFVVSAAKILISALGQVKVSVCQPMRRQMIRFTAMQSYSEIQL
jgi:hypothetical protein